jgi:hypothetical protein
MAARFGAGAPLTARGREPRPHLRRDLRRRQIGPVVEALEGRLLLTTTSPTNPLPIGPKPNGTATSHQLGAAYQQVLAIQTTTLRSLGDSYREVQAAVARLAARTAIAIDELNADLSQVKSRRMAHGIAASISRDRDLLDLVEADAAREEQGLDVARGLADQQASTDESAINNGRFTSLAELIEQDQSTGTAISRSGRRSENALVRELNKLGGRLTSTIPVPPSVMILQSSRDTILNFRGIGCCPIGLKTRTIEPRGMKRARAVNSRTLAPGSSARARLTPGPYCLMPPVHPEH